MELFPHITIVIITKDRPDDLHKLIASLEQQTYPKKLFDIIVVSEDKLEIAGIDNIISTKNLGFGAKRNLGLFRARGELVAFIDDDCIAPSDWLARIVESLRKNNTSAVGGSFLPQKTNSIGNAIFLLGLPGGGVTRIVKDKIYESPFISTGNAIAKRESLIKLGGFRSDLHFGGEDQDLFTRLNNIEKTIIDPDIFVYHKQRVKILEVYKWFIRRGRAQYGKDRPLNSPILTLFLPLRWSLTIKILSFLPLAIYFGIYPIAIILFLYFLVNYSRVYDRVVLFKKREQNINSLDVKYFNQSVLLLSPVVKLVMDIGYESGKYISFIQDIFNIRKIFKSPIVLTCHKIGERAQSAGDRNDFITLSKLENQIRYFQTKSFKITSISKYLEDKVDNAVIFTFDDAYSSIFKPLLSFKEKYNFTATIFVVADYIGKENNWDNRSKDETDAILNEDELRVLMNIGFDIGSHTKSHINFAKENNESKIEKEIFESKQMIENRLGLLPKTISLPFGGYKDISLSHLYKNYEYICTSVGGRWLQESRFIKRIRVKHNDTIFTLKMKIILYTLKDIVKILFIRPDFRFN